MEHLPQGVKDEEGCFVYQVHVAASGGDSIAVRSEMNVGDDDETLTKDIFQDGELVSVDLIRPSRTVGSTNGPFLRLADGSGWLFEKMFGLVVMTRIPVSTGLWCFYVDNGATGTALRRHPNDRMDMYIDDVWYQPMQKIYCDRCVQHPSTGVNFYRVQGTEGWVFDRQLETMDTMLLDEPMVETGVFVYECLDAVGIRSYPSIGEDNRTFAMIKEGGLVSADIIRKSPFPHGNGPFLRLSDGSGWLFENQRHEQVMKRLPVQTGAWKFQVLNDPAGIGLRRHPVDSPTVDLKYPSGSLIRCTHMVEGASGVKFYRVKDTEGWVFDKRNGTPMLELLSEDLSPRTGMDFSHGQDNNNNDDEKAKNAGNDGWSPEFLRGLAASFEGVNELSLDEGNRVMSFVKAVPYDGEYRVRINVYYKTRTVGTALLHPSEGATQLFRRKCDLEDLLDIFSNPRAHTAQEYKRYGDDDNDPSRFDAILDTLDGECFLADREIDARSALLELDKAIAALMGKKRRLLERIRETDLCRAQEAQEMKLKIQARTQEIQSWNEKIAKHKEELEASSPAKSPAKSPPKCPKSPT